MFLLDTNVVSELRKIRPHGVVASFRLWAKLMHRQSDTVYEDVMIAACALVHKRTVVMRNIRDSERFQVPVFNLFGARTF